MEVAMNKLRLATALSALTLAWVFSASTAYAVGHPEQSTTEQVMKSQSDEQPLSTKNKGAADTLLAPTGNKGATKTPPTKHPPTAIMDRATSSDKATAKTGRTVEHGPTRAMDRAAPDQKSPDAAASDSTEASAPAK
jgi:hypothetical protein